MPVFESGSSCSSIMFSRSTRSAHFDTAPNSARLRCTDELEGLIQRSTKQLFAYIRECQEDVEFILRCSLLEVNNSRIKYVGKLCTFMYHLDSSVVKLTKIPYLGIAMLHGTHIVLLKLFCRVLFGVIGPMRTKKWMKNKDLERWMRYDGDSLLVNTHFPVSVHFSFKILN